MPMISLQISTELMEKLDGIKEKLEFSSRSEALRESILYFIQDHQDVLPKGLQHQIAVLTIVHDSREDILDKFTVITGKYENILKTMNQYNLKRKIIKNIIVAGSGEEINELFHLLNSDRFFQTTITYIIV